MKNRTEFQFTPHSENPFEIDWLDTIDGEMLKKGEEADLLKYVPMYNDIYSEVSKYYDFNIKLIDQEVKKDLKYFDSFNDPISMNKDFLVAKAAKQILNSFFKIQQIINHKEDDWLENIEEFIQYNLYSFGSNVFGSLIYFENLQNLLFNFAGISDQNKIKILAHLKENSFNPENANKFIELTMIAEIYKRWLDLFPFDIPLFIEHKKKYSELLEKDELPIRRKQHYNRYLKKDIYRAISLKEFLDILKKTSEEILKSVDIPEIAKELKLNEHQHYEIELLNASFRVKNIKILDELLKEELNYIKPIDEWLELWLKYFRSIRQLLANQSNSNPDISLEDQKFEDNFRNNFNFEDSKNVYQYFRRELIDKELISEDDFKLFIKTAFENVEPLKSKLKFLKNVTKKRIIKIFAQFYKNSASFQGEKTKYVNLLVENFEGFHFKNTYDNFTRDV